MTILVAHARAQAPTLTCLAFVTYEYVSFRAAAIHNLATLGRIIANNSTASLAFDNRDDAQQVLSALKAEPHIDSAALYDSRGVLFARYRAAGGANSPNTPLPDGYRYEASNLIGVEPVQEGTNRRLGSLYLRSDLGALHEQLMLYSLIAATMTGLAFVVAYLLSRLLQQQISGPIQNCSAGAARAVSENSGTIQSVSARSPPTSSATSPTLSMKCWSRSTVATRNCARARAGCVRNSRAWTSYTASHVPSASDRTCAVCFKWSSGAWKTICRSTSAACSNSMRWSSFSRSPASAVSTVSWPAELGLSELERIPVDRNGLGRCVQGELVYEPDISASPFPFSEPPGAW